MSQPNQMLDFKNRLLRPSLTVGDKNIAHPADKGPNLKCVQLFQKYRH